jgi:hypothetical protein
MVISRSRAIFLGVSAIFCVIAVQAFSSFTCYGHDFLTFLGVLTFVAGPLIPAGISLTTANPLRAIGACLLFVPWLFFAYYTDCVLPYSGGGASMIYVVVLLWGTPSAVIGALVSGPITHTLGISVGGR